MTTWADLARDNKDWEPEPELDKTAVVHRDENDRVEIVYVSDWQDAYLPTPPAQGFWVLENIRPVDVDDNGRIEITGTYRRATVDDCDEMDEFDPSSLIDLGEKIANMADAVASKPGASARSGFDIDGITFDVVVSVRPIDGEDGRAS